jgi:hypothetical protein
MYGYKDRQTYMLASGLIGAWVRMRFVDGLTLPVEDVNGERPLQIRQQGLRVNRIELVERQDRVVPPTVAGRYKTFFRQHSLLGRHGWRTLASFLAKTLAAATDCVLTRVTRRLRKKLPKFLKK